MVAQLFAARLADAGISVYEIRPGIIDTDMTGLVHEQYDRRIADGLSTRSGAGGRPRTSAGRSPHWRPAHCAFSTGEVLHVDGGLHMRRL